MKRKHAEAAGTPAGDSSKPAVEAAPSTAKKQKRADAAGGKPEKVAKPDKEEKAAAKAAKAVAKAEAAKKRAAVDTAPAPEAAKAKHPTETPADAAAAKPDKAARKAAKAAAKAAAAAAAAASTRAGAEKPAAAAAAGSKAEAPTPAAKAAAAPGVNAKAGQTVKAGAKAETPKSAAKSAAAAAGVKAEKAPKSAATPAAVAAAAGAKAGKAPKSTAKPAAAADFKPEAPKSAAKPAAAPAATAAGTKADAPESAAKPSKAKAAAKPNAAAKPTAAASAKPTAKPTAASAKGSVKDAAKARREARRKKLEFITKHWKKNTRGVDVKVVVLHDPYVPAPVEHSSLTGASFAEQLLARKRNRPQRNRTPEQLAKQAQLKATPGPFLVNFSATSLDEGQEQALTFEAFGKQDDMNNNPAYIASQQPGAMLVGGTQAVPPQSGEDDAHYAIGLYNRKTHTLTLSEAAGPASRGGCIVRLESAPKNMRGEVEVAGLFKAEQNQQHMERPQDMAARRAEARRLVEAFGSTRRKRQMKQREEAAVVVDRNADQDQLELLMQEVAAKAEAAGETRQEVMSKLGAARVIPVHDPKATEPHMAYRQRAMFPDNLLASLNVGQLMHAAEKKENRQKLIDRQAVPAYVISRLHCITDETDERKRKQKARTLALLAALLQLATARSRLTLKPPRPAAEPGGRDRPGGLEELAWSLRIGRKEVLQPLLENFYNRSVDGGTTMYVRENHKHQLLLMHVLVVALDVEGWVLAAPLFDALCKELKMTAPDVVSRFRELGCTCTAAKLAAGVAADGNPTAAVASYNVALLPTGKKTLEESFPKFKTGAKQRAGR